jgi:hypothetical protein
MNTVLFVTSGYVSPGMSTADALSAKLHYFHVLLVKKAILAILQKRADAASFRGRLKCQKDTQILSLPSYGSRL